MSGRHKLLAGRRRRATLAEMVDVYTLITHLVTPDSAAAPGARGCHVALCGADVFPALFTQVPGNGYCQPCRTSVPTQRSGKTRITPQHGGGADHSEIRET